jgi:hypothetical protein
MRGEQKESGQRETILEFPRICQSWLGWVGLEGGFQMEDSDIEAFILTSDIEDR